MILEAKNVGANALETRTESQQVGEITAPSSTLPGSSPISWYPLSK